ncbi:MFS transporter [Actinomadura craniellae]|uniref:MFS transporter n=1 Tax=Actinomadura craniellae TaxID=2231787 RepID=UPI001314C892|nr:MFS transporter [Actinomadura craniellae]
MASLDSEERPEASLWLSDFRLLWRGTAAAQLGTMSTTIAGPLLALYLTESPVFAGWVTAAGTLPGLLFYIPAGIVVDHFDRRRIMLISQGARLLVAAAMVLTLLLIEDPPPELLILAAFADGALTTFYNTAELTIIRRIVPKPHLEWAMARNESRGHCAFILGRPAGGALYGLDRSFPFALDILCSLISIFTLLRLKTKSFLPERNRSTDHTFPPGKGLLKGMTWLWGHGYLRRVVFVCTISNFCFQTIFLLLMVQVEAQQIPSWLIGTLLAATGLGGALGSFFAPQVLKHVSPSSVVVLCTIFWITLPLTVLVNDQPYAGIAAWAGASFMGANMNVALGIFMSTSIPDHLMGRVSSVNGLLTRGATPLGALCGGYVISHLNTRIAVGVITTVIAALALGLIIAHLRPFRQSGRLFGDRVRMAIAVLATGMTITISRPPLRNDRPPVSRAHINLAPTKRCPIIRVSVLVFVQPLTTAVPDAGAPPYPALTGACGEGEHATVTGSLNMKDRNRLVDALMQLNSMSNRRTRDLLIQTVQNELEIHLPVERQNQDRHDVWALVNACLAYPGAVHTLVTAIAGFHRGSMPMAELHDLVDELLPEPLLESHERRELRQLTRVLEASHTNTAHPALIPALYHAAVGPFGPPLRSTACGLDSVISRLEEVAVGPDGVPPLLTFVRDLAGHSREPIAAALRNWSSRIRTRLGLEQSWPLAIAPQVADAPESSAYLVIEFRPDLADDDMFLTTAWLQFGREPATPLHRDDVPVPREDLPALVRTFLFEHPQVVTRHTMELVIEFVLPRSLLNEDFDQMKLTVGGVPRRLGVEYPVVLRSLDRLRQPALHHRWRRKWNWLRDNPQSARVYRVDEPSEADHERLYTRLSEPYFVCLALAFPPYGKDPAPADEHWVGVQAGVPIIAWCRRPWDPELFAAEFRKLLDAGLMALPDSVTTLRKQAVLMADAEADHLGLHLSLIFDDADRMPEPYLRLSAPA